MLEAVQKLCENPKIEPGDHGNLVRALMKVRCNAKSEKRAGLLTYLDSVAQYQPTYLCSLK